VSALPPALEAAYLAASAAHPEVALDRRRYAAFVAERLGEGAPEGEVAADLFLVCALTDGSTNALEHFDALYLSQLPQFLSRLETSAAERDEIGQRLRERLFVGAPGGAGPKIAEYRGHGRLGSWLRVVAIRTALNLRAGRKEQPGGEQAADALAAAADPELEYLRARYQGEFRAAFGAALAALEARDRTLLRLQLVDGLNIDAIGRLYGVHRATVARWLGAAREQLFTSTRDRLHRELGVSPAEFASLVRLVRSQLDVSVCRILAETQEP
jgi:RNA polymerase sigma-70 factor (ECF subfamily)